MSADDGLRYAIAHVFEEDQGVPLMHGMAVARRLLDGPLAELRARAAAADRVREMLNALPFTGVTAGIRNALDGDQP